MIVHGHGEDLTTLLQIPDRGDCSGMRLRCGLNRGGSFMRCLFETPRR